MEALHIDRASQPLRPPAQSPDARHLPAVSVEALELTLYASSSFLHACL